jgi:hypothetical protein
MESQLKRAASSGGCGIAELKCREEVRTEQLRKKARQLGKRKSSLVMGWGVI